MCLLCHRASEKVHPRCIKFLDARLERIPALYAMLPLALEPSSTDGTRVSGTRTPPTPLLVEPLSLLCRGGIVAILATWETDWRNRRHLAELPARADREHLLEGVQVLGEVVDFLRTHLDWAVHHHPAIEEFAGEVGDITAACRAALSLTTELEKIGRCPAQLGDHTYGRVLYADPYLDIIRCDRCRTEWPRARWLLLGAAIAQGDAA